MKSKRRYKIIHNKNARRNEQNYHLKKRKPTPYKGGNLVQ